MFNLAGKDAASAAADSSPPLGDHSLRFLSSSDRKATAVNTMCLNRVQADEGTKLNIN
jgi:hypothetical protein